MGTEFSVVKPFVLVVLWPSRVLGPRFIGEGVYGFDPFTFHWSP